MECTAIVIVCVKLLLIRPGRLTRIIKLYYGVTTMESN